MKLQFLYGRVDDVQFHTISVIHRFWGEVSRFFSDQNASVCIGMDSNLSSPYLKYMRIDTHSASFFKEHHPNLDKSCLGWVEDGTAEVIVRTRGVWGSRSYYHA